MSFGGDFAGWTVETLSRQLRLEGLDIPRAVDEESLLYIAENHYDGRDIPEPPANVRLQYQYVPSSQVEATIRTLAQQQHELDGGDYDDEEEKADDDTLASSISERFDVAEEMSMTPERVMHQESFEEPSLARAQRYVQLLCFVSIFI